MSDEDGQFQSRIEALRNRGFDVVAPTGDMASEEMLRLEEMVEFAAKVRVKVLDLPEHRSDERQRLLAQLTNPMEAGDVDIELSGLLRRHRPWVILAERSRAMWSTEGRSVELTHILERLDAIDDAVVMSSPRILSMIEEVCPARDMEPVLIEIERRQARRVEALHGMTEMLSEHGWELGAIKTGTIEEQFNEAERIYAMDTQLSQCKRKIENEIRPFDHNIAERLKNGISRAQHDATEASVEHIASEIDACADDLSQRLGIVESRIATWQSEGFTIPVTLPLLANEMLSWEERLPEMNEQIESMRLIWTQVEPHLHQWPEYRALAERTLGHLGAVDALDVLLQGLQSKTDGAKSECHSRLESWNSHGIDTSYWMPLVGSEPRAVLQELDEHQPFIDIIIANVQRLQALDTSIDGDEEVENWLQQLRSHATGMDVVAAVEDWLNLATKRRERHRDYLDSARTDLMHKWPADLDPRTLDLAMYEATISNLISEPYKPNLSKPKPAKKLPTLIPVAKEQFESDVDKAKVAFEDGANVLFDDEDDVAFDGEPDQELDDDEVLQNELVDDQEEIVEDDDALEPLNDAEMMEPPRIHGALKSKKQEELSDSQPEILTMGIRELFGLSPEDGDEWIVPPLDVRVQRLIRLAILLENGDTEEHRILQNRLPKIAKRLEEWTVERLSRRHASSGNGLLKDAKELGSRLADIPGPGTAMPLSKDNFELPNLDDLDGLSSAIKRLERSVILPSASIQITEPVES